MPGGKQPHTYSRYTASHFTKTDTDSAAVCSTVQQCINSAAARTQQDYNGTPSVWSQFASVTIHDPSAVYLSVCLLACNIRRLAASSVPHRASTAD